MLTLVQLPDILFWKGHNPMIGTQQIHTCTHTHITYRISSRTETFQCSFTQELLPFDCGERCDFGNLRKKATSFTGTLHSSVNRIAFFRDREGSNITTGFGICDKTSAPNGPGWLGGCLLACATHSTCKTLKRAATYARLLAT